MVYNIITTVYNLIPFMHQMESNKLTQDACFSVIPQILRKSTLKFHDIISLDLALTYLFILMI